MSHAETPAQSPTTAPTERSIPPPISTAVMPTARIIVNTDWLMTLRKFNQLRKFGDKKLISTQTITRKTATPAPGPENACRSHDGLSTAAR